MKFTMNVALQYMGFKGEGIVTDKCLINKTHFPYRTPMDKQYTSELILIAVRNPLDVIVSFFQMIGSQTHTQSFLEPINEGPIKHFWDEFFTQDVLIWLRWHDFWMEKIKTQEVPVFFFRFEDLL